MVTVEESLIASRSDNVHALLDMMYMEIPKGVNAITFSLKLSVLLVT